MFFRNRLLAKISNVDIMTLKLMTKQAESLKDIRSYSNLNNFKKKYHLSADNHNA